MHTYQYHKFEFCKRNEYTHRHREKRCTEDRSARTGLSRLLVVFRSTRRDDRRTKQLLRFDRVLTDDKTINLENLSPVFFHPFFSIRDESEARAHSTWKNFRGEMRTFAEVRRNSSAVYLSTPHQLLTQGSIRAFRRSNQDSLLMQQDIYA